MGWAVFEGGIEREAERITGVVIASHCLELRALWPYLSSELPSLILLMVICLRRHFLLSPCFELLGFATFFFYAYVNLRLLLSLPSFIVDIWYCK